MGCKSSFALASLAHHMLIHYSFYRLNKEDRKIMHIKDSYVLVGDDVVFFNESLMIQVRKDYGIIDVEIQDIKSRIPVKQPGSDIIDNFAEFCSRSSVNTVDISRLSPILIRDAAKNWQNIPALLIHAKERGVALDISLIEDYLIRRSGSSPSASEIAKRSLNMSRLKTVLSFPILGQDLTEFSDKIDHPTIMPDGIHPWQVHQLV